MAREILISVTVNWDDYDDVDTDLIMDDVFESLTLKDGVKIEIVGDSKDRTKCPICDSPKVYFTAAICCDHCAVTSNI